MAQAANGERYQEIRALKLVRLDELDDQTVQGYVNEINLLRRLDGNKRIIQLFDSEIVVRSFSFRGVRLGIGANW